MIIIKYNSDALPRQVEFHCSGHIATLYGAEVNTSGFTTWMHDGRTKLGDFSAFTTVYRKTEHYVQYSDDGSVYAEEQEQIPLPSLEERINDLEIALCEIVDALG